MKHNDDINQLRREIKRELRNSSHSATPKIYELISTKEGYMKVENMIINYVIANKVSIGAAIAQLDAEL